MRGGPVVTHRLTGAGLASDPGAGGSQPASWSLGKSPLTLPPAAQTPWHAWLSIRTAACVHCLGVYLSAPSLLGHSQLGWSWGRPWLGTAPSFCVFTHIAGATQCHLASLFLIQDERFYKGWKRSRQSTVSSRTESGSEGECVLVEVEKMFVQEPEGVVGFLEEGLLRGRSQLCRKGSGGPGKSESREGGERKPTGTGGTGRAHGWAGIWSSLCTRISALIS